MTPTAEATRRIERDFVALNFRLAVAASQLRTRASLAIEAALFDLGKQAISDVRAANKLARDTIVALS